MYIEKKYNTLKSLYLIGFFFLVDLIEVEKTSCIH